MKVYEHSLPVYSPLTGCFIRPYWTSFLLNGTDVYSSFSEKLQSEYNYFWVFYHSLSEEVKENKSYRKYGAL